MLRELSLGTKFIILKQDLFVISDSDALLIVSGDSQISTAEMWTPDGKQCILPSLPERRSDGSQQGFLYCGGRGDSDAISKSCVQFENGSWKTYPEVLKHPRWYHASWKTDDGIAWIGGELGER